MTKEINEEIRKVADQIEKTTKRMENITCRGESPHNSMILMSVRTKLNVLLYIIVFLVICLGSGGFAGGIIYKHWRQDQERLHELTKFVKRQNMELIELHKDSPEVKKFIELFEDKLD